jgi:superkiller protein 3
VNQNPDAAWAYHSYGYALGRKGLTDRTLIDRAIDQLETAVRLDPKLGAAWNTLGAAYWRAKRPDEAIDAYLKACKHSPKSAIFRFDVGAEYLRQSKWNEAIDHLNRATVLDPTYAAAWDDLGYSYVRVGKLVEAIRSHKRAIALQPGRTLYNTRLAAALIARGDTPQAAMGLYKELKPPPPQAAQTAFYTALANAYLQKGYQDAAILVQNELIKTNSSDPGAHMALGNLYYRKGNFVEALKYYNSARELNPTLLNAHRYVAMSHMRLQQYKEAKKAHEDALYAEGDGGPNSSNDLAFFLVSCPDKSLRDPSRAVILSKKAIKRAPRAWLLHNVAGIANYRAENYAAAISALDTAMEEHVRSEGNVMTWLCMAMAQWQLDKKDKAKKWYDKGVKWCNENKPNDFVKELKAEADALMKK